MAVRIFRSQVVGTRYDGAPLEWIECACDSDDDKPIGVATGSQCTEADTGDVYMYSEDDAAWNKVSSLGGGGGSGGGGAGVFEATYTITADEHTGEITDIVCNKTHAEILQAHTNGAVVRAKIVWAGYEQDSSLAALSDILDDFCLMFSCVSDGQLSNGVRVATLTHCVPDEGVENVYYKGGYIVLDGLQTFPPQDGVGGA